MVHNRAAVCALLLRHLRRACWRTGGSFTGPIVGRWKQLVQSCNLARRQVHYEDGVECSLGRGWSWCRMWQGAHPFYEEYLAPFGGGMCASAVERQSVYSWLAGGLLVAAFCPSGVTIKGDLRLSCSSSINRARRRAVKSSAHLTRFCIYNIHYYTIIIVQAFPSDLRTFLAISRSS
jgi:hypothetical protein